MYIYQKYIQIQYMYAYTLHTDCHWYSSMYIYQKYIQIQDMYRYTLHTDYQVFEYTTYITKACINMYFMQSVFVFEYEHISQIHKDKRHV